MTILEHMLNVIIFYVNSKNKLLNLMIKNGYVSFTRNFNHI